MASRSQTDADAEGKCSNSPPYNASFPPLPRACESCHSRKIRCDKNSPCSHCIQAGIPCIKATRRPREKRKRVVASSRHEEKLELIDRRLEGVTQILHDMKTGWAPPVAQSAPSISPVASGIEAAVQVSSTPFGDISQAAVNSPVVEGESSFTAQSAFASEFLHNAVRDVSFQGSDRNMSEIMDSLHCIISTLKRQTSETEMSYPLARETPCPSLRGSALPPIEITVALIRSAKSWIYDFFPLEYLSDICLRIYFSKDFSVADFIIANAGLQQLFREHSQSTSDDKTKSLEHLHMCRTNLETALINLPLHLPGTSSMIAALLLGAFHAIEISKPSLAWTLSSKASELCQTLGYHRIPSIETSNVSSNMRYEQFLFWSIYFIDKSLSLRLGRASTIQNWDITTPVLSVHDSRSPLAASVTMWVNTARCQGNVYEHLYSPESISQPDEIRESRVRALSNDLQEISRTACEISAHHLQNARNRFGDRIVEFITLSDDVLRLSLLTLVYRASPPAKDSASAFIPDCIEAARATLQRHQDFLTIFEDVNSLYFINYVHWTLLFAPFTPFIVLFCHVIETQDKADLNHLNAFVTSMESVPSLSDAASKMHHLFQVLYRIALRYVECRSSATSEEQTEASASVNTYLTALGFPPMNQDNCQRISDMVSVSNQDFQPQNIIGETITTSGMEGNGVVHPTMWIGHTTELREWFNGNHYVMELLEEPNFTFP
ncbi:hypothetical protein B0J13DRAFT_649065 [Dactylonectria estremocensis]|uniref:Zn(2)-C6 fungal-type domain-containing protein n=1 Tax=Dactylonectria estremocensis TaxID=1079267 RepID=A0A9P9DJF3_9HYPO|nr:hypothetical protein B0J13DRAFT_649065 [Dactylonectria estremocensis]